jgi:ubiquinone/menaquinone biosynthesis C-methylase UbiE
MTQNLDVMLKIVREFGFELKPGSLIMDFGCGNGKLVKELNDHGYKAYGCDIKPNTEEKVDQNAGTFRTIKFDPYILPFEDNSFDLIVSYTVFEHVQNYSEAISELARVLKPDGFCLHIFPSRYNPNETHIFVPFSTMIHSYWWLYIWAALGIRNEFQAGLSVKEKATDNYNYLKENTNYLSKNRIRKHFKQYFKEVMFCEKQFLKFSRRARSLYTLTNIIPFIPSIYSAFRGRVILTKSPDKTAIVTTVPQQPAL